MAFRLRIPFHDCNLRNGLSKIHLRKLWINLNGNNYSQSNVSLISSAVLTFLANRDNKFCTKTWFWWIVETFPVWICFHFSVSNFGDRSFLNTSLACEVKLDSFVTITNTRWVAGGIVSTIVAVRAKLDVRWNRKSTIEDWSQYCFGTGTTVDDHDHLLMIIWWVAYKSEINPKKLLFTYSPCTERTWNYKVRLTSRIIMYLLVNKMSFCISTHKM